MKGYPKWFSNNFISSFVGLFFISGLSLIPTTLFLRLDFLIPWRLAENSLIAANMIHNAISLLMLLMLGSLLSLHVRRGWQKRRHRLSGSILIIVIFFLLFTGLMILYSGNENLSFVAGLSHMVVGSVFILIYCWHLFVGSGTKEK